MSIKKTTMEDVAASEFIAAIEQVGAVPYFVGGCVRDYCLNREYKDIDLVVDKIFLDDLINILEPLGKTDLVGKSFGVIKFRPNEDLYLDEELDISVPRLDKNIVGDNSHQGLEVQHGNVSVEEDVRRRDFTINGMLMDMDLNIIDFYNGMGDIETKTIKEIDPIAFVDDPLRIIRAIQFAARFDFKIDDITMSSMVTHIEKLTNLPMERIVGEIEKIVSKADSKSKGALLFARTRMIEHLFGADTLRFHTNNFDKINHIGDFIFGLSNKNILPYMEGMDSIITKRIEALNILYASQGSSIADSKWAILKAYKKDPNIIDSVVLPYPFQEIINKMIENKEPFNSKQLAVSGQQIMDRGYIGVEIGNVQSAMLELIYRGERKNEFSELIKYLK